MPTHHTLSFMAALPLLFLLTACSSLAPTKARKITHKEKAAEIETTIHTLLKRQTDAWNEGKLTTFIESYLDSPQTRFASGSTVHYGTNNVLKRYQQKYPDRASMGQLSFTDLSVQALSSNFVFVFGRYILKRKGGTSTGLFTLLLKLTAEGWKISHDHTSSG